MWKCGKFSCWALVKVWDCRKIERWLLLGVAPKWPEVPVWESTVTKKGALSFRSLRNLNYEMQGCPLWGCRDKFGPSDDSEGFHVR